MDESNSKPDNQVGQQSTSDELERARKHIIFLENSLSGLQLEYENVARRIERYDLSLVKAYQLLADKSHEADELKTQLSLIEQLKSELEYSQVVIRSAEKWQKRSLLKRCFHKWKAPARKLQKAALDLSVLNSLQTAEKLIGSEQAKQLGIDIKLNSLTVAFGVIANNCTLEELDLSLNSISHSLKAITSPITPVLYLKEEGLKYSNKEFVIKNIQEAESLNTASVHNLFMKNAFAQGAHFYIIVSERGSCASSTTLTLLEHAFASEQRSIIESVTFPLEQAKGYSPETFQTPYNLPTFTLIPNGIYESVGHFDERLNISFAMIDFSWRARLAGFTLKVCPRSLYFHPLGHLARDSRALEDYLVSGIILARKYGCRSFERKMMAQAILNEISLPPIPPVQMTGQPVSENDFDAISSFDENQL